MASYRNCPLAKGSDLVLLALDSDDPDLSPREHTWSLLNFFSIAGEDRIPDPNKQKGKYPTDPGVVLKFLLVSAFKSKGVKPAPEKWDFNVPNNIQPNKGGGPFDFIRGDDELDVDRRLFLLRDLLAIKIVHGWIDHPNPKGPGDNDEERGLTQYGLDYLIKEIDEDETALMFRDGSLNVVTQHNGCLYLLETDKATLNKLPVVFWRTVTLDKSHEILFKDKFIPLDLCDQPNREVPAVVDYFRRLDELGMRPLADVLAEIEGEEQDHRRNSTQATGKKKKKKKPTAEAAKSSLTGQTAGKKETKPVAEGAKSSLTGQTAGKKETKPVAAAGQAASKEKTKPTAEAAGIHPVPSAAEAPAGNVDSDDDGYKWVRETFKNFLEWFIDPDDDAPTKMPFYLRVVEGWKGLPDARNIPYSCRIYFSHIQHQDKNLALAIVNGGRRLHDVLDQVFLDFRVSLNCGSKEELEGKVKVRVIGMPPAGSICKFEDFIEENNTQLAEPWKLWDGHIMNAPTYIGRRAGQGYVNDLLKNHREGKSWGGKISKSDLGIKDGYFQILTLPGEDVTSENIYADFMKLIGILVKLYTTKESALAPAYFHVFQADVLAMRDCGINSRDFRVYQRYFSHHMVFKPPLVRAGLFIDMWGVIQCLCIMYKNGKREPFTRLQARAFSWTVPSKFYTNFRVGWFFNKVYWYHNSSPIDKYGLCYYINLLELIRHLEMHLHDHTRDENGEQLLEDPVLVDLMIAETLDELIARLVFQMMLELDDAPFAKSWKKFEMTESGDVLHLENTVSEGGKGNEKQSAGKFGSSESRDVNENFPMLEPPETHGDAFGLHAQKASIMLNQRTLLKHEQLLKSHRPGLSNLHGVSCYMNSTLQCLRVVPELNEALSRYPDMKCAEISAEDHNLTIAARDLFLRLDQSSKPVKPDIFFQMMLKACPDFAILDDNNELMQQDAQEFWTIFLNKVSETLKSEAPIISVKKLFWIEFATRTHCAETGEVTFGKDSDNILRSRVSRDIKTLQEGLKRHMREDVEKHSPLLKQNAMHTTDLSISELPIYLTVQLPRISWEDSLKISVKHCHEVKFPSELDMYEFCSDELKQKLQAPGKAMYDLVTVLTHQGPTVNRGHNMAWVKEPSGKWTRLDDSFTSTHEETEVLSLCGGSGDDKPMAYLCLYKARFI